MKFGYQKFAVWMVTVAMFTLAAGCGQSPLVPDRAEKPAIEEIYETVTRVIGPDGGTLMLALPSGSDEDRLEVWFYVEAGSLESDHTITMAILGESLSALNIYFQPDGLTFQTDARLQVKIGEERVDLLLENLNVWHHSSEGSEIVEHDIDYVPGGAIIDVDVPGFSRYSFDE